MIKYFDEFISGFFKVLMTFVITFITAVVSTNNQNYIYTLLEKNGLSDVTLQKAILSGVIVAGIGILQLLLNLIGKVGLWILKIYFKRLTLNIKFKAKNCKNQTIKFKPKGGEYIGEEVDIELEVVPAGKISMLLLKLLGLQVKVFFNPQIIDIHLLNDKEWLNEKTDTRINKEQCICIKLLAEYRLDGSSTNKFIKTERILIIPKRVKSDTTSINFKLSSNFGMKISNALCASNMMELNIECKGGN